jgi:sugar-specific transcriptional regulator TrmB
MIDVEENIKLFQDLGLTPLQAEIYFKLSTLGKSTASMLAKKTGKARPEIYRILNEILKLNLAEKILGYPNLYESIPIEEAVISLQQKRNRKNNEIELKIKKLLKINFHKPSKNEDKSKFVLIPSKRTPKKISDAINRSKFSIDLIVSLQRFIRGLHVFSENLSKANKRKVKWRVIIEHLPEEKIPLMAVNKFYNNSYSEIRSFPKPIHTALGLYDQNEVFIIEEPGKGLSDSPALWSNNHSITSLVKDYFSFLWETAEVLTNDK